MISFFTGTLHSSRLKPALSLLFLVFLVLGHANFAAAQNTPTFSSNSTLNNPAANNSLENRENPFSAFDTGEEFLQVDEAYQLSVRLSDTHVIAQWVIADHYFLYGEQFAFSAQGSKLTASLPEGKISYDEIFEKDVEKHYVYVQASIDNTLLSDNNTLLAITYQGCADAGLCYPPETKYFDVNIQQQTVSQTSSPVSTATTDTSTTPQLRETTPWVVLLMLCSALLGGLLLNLMPCVFPVLSIKALSLANNHHSDRIHHGWSYTLGCVFTFIVIASLLLIIRDSGKAVGWGFQLQSPGMITFLAFLFIVMGMSLSGLFSFGYRWMNMGQSLTEGKGVKQSFFTGALAAIVASPCTAPFMATALGYALTQPTHIALGIFATLGLGMALPFLILGYLPQLGNRLPQPGPWMGTFKQALAFPLYLTSVWLLWVLGHQTGTDSVMLAALGVVLILFMLWLSGKIPQLQSTSFVLSLLLVAGIIWNNQTSLTTQRAQTNAYWEQYSPDKLAQLRAQGTPVFVNLTADWCITCKANEKFVFTDKTLKMMKERGITLLEGDWTNYNADITGLLDNYGRAGVPLYLLFPAKPGAEATILPQILTPSSFKNQIDKI